MARCSEKSTRKLMIGWISRRFVSLNGYGGYVVQLFVPTGPHTTTVLVPKSVLGAESINCIRLKKSTDQ